MAEHESTSAFQRIVRDSAASIPISFGLFVGAAMVSQTIARQANLNSDGYMLAFGASAMPLAFYLSYAKRRKPIWWLPLFVWIACLVNLLFGAAFRAFGLGAVIPWEPLQDGLPVWCAFVATVFLMRLLTLCWLLFFRVTRNDR